MLPAVLTDADFHQSQPANGKLRPAAGSKYLIGHEHHVKSNTTNEISCGVGFVLKIALKEESIYSIRAPEKNIRHFGEAFEFEIIPLLPLAERQQRTSDTIVSTNIKQQKK